MNFVSILLCAGLASGLASASITALTPSDQALIVNLHNNFRFRQPAKDMTPIRWDAALARQAQSWTDRCHYGHQYSRAFGENIGAGGGPGYDTNSGIINHVFNLWVDEAKYNTDGKFTCCGVGGFKCCHFLQVIWAYSTKIGCGLTPCPWGNYLACYYQPKGNIMMNGKMTPYTPR